jgi:hypothetical protein
MARLKLQSERAVIRRCEALREELQDALGHASTAEPAVVEAVWRGEALGTLLWALQLGELPPYDEPFAPDEVAAADLQGAALRAPEEIDLEREAARLWHWRARTADLEADGSAALPERYSSYAQLVASVAMRGYEQGFLPEPVRGDFRAYGADYRRLDPDRLDEAHAIAAERHHALGWLTSPGTAWGQVPLDT